MGDASLSAEERVFGPLVEGRDCGECVACCVMLDIPELRKPADQTCPHCTGASCAKYETRPNACRTWYCAWRRRSAMPEAARPDRCGVMFELVTPKAAQHLLAKVFIRGQALNDATDFLHPLVIKSVELFRRDMVPVWLSHGGKMRLAHPGGAIAQVLLHNQPPASPAIAAEAQKWRAIYDR